MLRHKVWFDHTAQCKKIDVCILFIAMPVFILAAISMDNYSLTLDQKYHQQKISTTLLILPDFTTKSELGWNEIS